MVLEKLGESLKNTLAKIARIGYVDKKAVEELASDIKSSLIKADVDIQLAQSIADRIKKRAIAEKPAKTLTAREHTINIVYEELVKLLGREKEELDVKKKPTYVMLVGLFGSGKCVHPDSLIPLANGRTLSAECVYNELSKDCIKKVVEEGEIVDISEKNILIPSFNPETLKVDSKRLTHLWKLKNKKLIKVNLDNGNDFSVKVTPEHPFFVLRKGELLQIRADELTEDDYVAVPRSYNSTSERIDLFRALKHLDLDVDVSTNKPIFNNTIKQMHSELLFKRNYCTLTSNIKKGIVPIQLLNESGPFVRIKTKNSFKFVYFPRHLTAELAEFVGYLFGDGHLGKNYVEFVNEDPEIINKFEQLAKTLFGVEIDKKHDVRTIAMYVLRISSLTLVEILNKLFGMPIGKKGKKLAVPEVIFQSEKDAARSFIRAYFDCDAFSSPNREIELASESELMVRGINALLLRFGIVSSVSKKIIKDVSYWRLYVRARHSEKYFETIGFKVNHKHKRAEKYAQIGIVQGCGKQDMIPLAQFLQNTRLALGFSIGEIQNCVSSYGRYESKGLISRESLLKTVELYKEKQVGMIIPILSALNQNQDLTAFSRQVINGSIWQFIDQGFITRSSAGMLSVTEKGLMMLSGSNKFELLTYLERLALSDVCWFRVSGISDLDGSAYVYDFTVEDNHSFIADGIIVHNTTSAGKLALFFKKKGLKTAVLQTDTWRPAAYEQLKQLAEKQSIPFFGDKKEKDPVKIFNSAKERLKKFDLVIVDSAGRDALNKELIEEIDKLNKAIKPEEKLLVISGDIGQTAQSQAQKFHDTVGVTGVIVTKLDGTAKGGGAITACSATQAKVKFIGVGEKPDDFEQFKPKNFVSRLLGMGDLETLLEKASAAIDKEQAEKLGKKLAKGDFTLQDLYDQMKAMKNMGSLKQIASMIPGFSNIVPKELLSQQETKMDAWKYLMDSMTVKELENPEIINLSRVKRIAKGSGRKEAEVRELIKQYKLMKKMMKGMSGGKMGKLAKMMGKGGMKLDPSMLKGLKF